MKRSVLMIIVLSICATSSFAEESGKVKTFFFTGGPIHDYRGIGDSVERAMNAYGRFDVTRFTSESPDTLEADLDHFKAENLEGYDLVVFYSTLGTISEEQKRGLMNFVANGGGFATFHSGADSFRGDPDYTNFVGGYFTGHPAYRPFQVSCVPNHPITEGMVEFITTDEQYFVSYDERVNVIATSMWDGKLVPIAWTRPWGRGRVYYNSLGHDAAAVENDGFQRMFLRGALWAAGEKNLDPAPDADVSTIFNQPHPEGRVDFVRHR